MTDAPEAAEGTRFFRTEQYQYPAGKLRYARMFCPAGVSMTSMVTLVPMEHARSYMAHEIASEGRWRAGVPLIVILPPGRSDRPAPTGWFADLYAEMRRARKRQAPPLYRLRDGSDIDIGILDIQIALHVPLDGMAAHLIENGTFTAENFAFLDVITGKRIAPPMVFATAFHNYHSNGSYQYHFHNLIFGLRKEPRGPDGKERFGTIELAPLIDALNEHHDQRIIGGQKALP